MIVTIRIDDQLYRARIQEYVPLQRLIPALASSLGLREKFISLRHNGRILSPEETLAAAGIRDGAVLDLVVLPFTPLSSADLNNLLGLLDRLLRGFQDSWDQYKKSCARLFGMTDVKSLTDQLHQEFKFMNDQLYQEFTESLEFSGGVVDRIPIEEQREFVRWIIGTLLSGKRLFYPYMGEQGVFAPTFSGVTRASQETRL
jgi:uncharacterized ubiquitin-like protein YukD